jgi:energy-coupling factor transport system ATP-binding protein
MVIPSGAFVAILGATGSGKSTLVQCMAGLIKPTRGSVIIGPYRIEPHTKSTSVVRQTVGLVFQYPEHQLFEETVAKDIAFGPVNRGFPPEEVKRRVELAMRWVGLSPDLADRSPFQLSGGQMRRVAIAGVLALKPAVLILDEPTAGLDPRGKNELLELLARLNREQGLTVILVTHEMDDAARYTDSLFVLSAGRLVLSGTPGEVFSRQKDLERFNLGLPRISRLVQKLNRHLEPPLPFDAFTLDELEQALVKRRKRGDFP